MKVENLIPKKEQHEMESLISYYPEDAGTVGELYRAKILLNRAIAMLTEANSDDYDLSDWKRYLYRNLGTTERELGSLGTKIVR